jgi:hypothetical protein
MAPSGPWQLNVTNTFNFLVRYIRETFFVDTHESGAFFSDPHPSSDLIVAWKTLVKCGFSKGTYKLGQRKAFDFRRTFCGT